MEMEEKLATGKGELTTGQKSCLWLTTARVALDARIRFFEKYKADNAASQRYVSLAITALEKARMYMGKLLGIYGTHSPYPEGYNPENSEVRPPADTYPGELPTVHIGQEVIYIKQQRKDLSVVVKGAESLRGHFSLNSDGNLFLNQVVIGLYDCTNWLGMELNSLVKPKAPHIQSPDEKIEEENKDNIAGKAISKEEIEDLLH